jgi:hypothetical protein
VAGWLTGLLAGCASTSSSLESVKKQKQKLNSVSRTFGWYRLNLVSGEQDNFLEPII